MKRNILIVLIYFISIYSFAQQMPDTIGNKDGWRYATDKDINYWPNVKKGDVIIFRGSSFQRDLDTRQYDSIIKIKGGNKIHLWRGDYKRIYLSTEHGIIEENSSETAPIIITNLGGQVVWGNDPDSYKRGLEVLGIKHVFLTGEYDTILGTGDSKFKGMKGDLTQRGWHKRFGLVGDQRFLSYQMNDAHGLGVKINKFLTAKVRGVASMNGYFAGFNVKNDVGDLDPITIDIHNCFAGWTEGEGFYLGYNGSTDGSTVSENKIICRDNVVLFSGYEGIQADFMRDSSLIQNNFVFKTGCSYQVSFQGAHYQENGFQWSFTESGLVIRDNIIYSANAGSILVGPRYKDPGESRKGEKGKITFTNNLLGSSRRGVGFIFEGDKDSLITYVIDNNVIDSITINETNDAYEPEIQVGFLNIGNSTNSIYLRNNIFPKGRSVYQISNGNGSNIKSVEGTVQKYAPLLRMNKDFGFEPTSMLSLKGIWLNGLYGEEVTSEGPIAYNVDDVVFKVTKSYPRYYKCIQSHTTVKDPEVETLYWEQVFWENNEEPVYCPLLQPNSYYNYRGMGLTFNPEPDSFIDTISPVIEIDTIPMFLVDDFFVVPPVKVTDNKDKTISYTYFYPNGTPSLSHEGRILSNDNIIVQYNATDSAGNRAEPLIISYSVNSCKVEMLKTAKINFNRNSLYESGEESNYWNNLGGTSDGLITDANTVTNLFDVSKQTLPWVLTIPDGTGNVSSKHYGIITEDNSIEIGLFPAGVTKQGIQLREGLETECHFIFDGLTSSNFYDLQFTGYIEGTGKVNVIVQDSLSGNSVVFNVINNTNSYSLQNIKPDNSGRIILKYCFYGAVGRKWRAVSSIGGMIITEKNGSGDVGEFCLTPTEIILTNQQIEEGNDSGIGFSKIISDGRPTPHYTVTIGETNSLFTASADSLYLNFVSDYELKSEYILNLSAENTQGSINKDFTIQIIDVPGEKDTSSDVIIFPNPSTKIIEISFIKDSVSTLLTVLDKNANIVFRKHVNISNHHASIDISRLRSGIYFLVIGEKENAEIRKFVVYKKE